MRSRIAALALVGLAALIGGCGGNLQESIKTKAAHDFDCSAEEIQLTEAQPYKEEAAYHALGCGVGVVYEGHCAFDGCVVSRVPSAEERLRMARRDPRRPAQVEAPAEKAPATKPEPPKPLGAKVKLRLYNDCERPIDIMVSERPGTMDGDRFNLGARSSQAQVVRENAAIWIVGDDGKAAGKTTVSATTKELRVGGSCMAFKD